MINYTAISLKADDVHFEAKDDRDSIDWVVSHLDLSKNWTILKTTKTLIETQEVKQ
jgi:hypothetical protein